MCVCVCVSQIVFKPLHSVLHQHGCHTTACTHAPYLFNYPSVCRVSHTPELTCVQGTSSRDGISLLDATCSRKSGASCWWQMSADVQDLVHRRRLRRCTKSISQKSWLSRPFFWMCDICSLSCRAGCTKLHVDSLPSCRRVTCLVHVDSLPSSDSSCRQVTCSRLHTCSRFSVHAVWSPWRQAAKV